MAQEMEKVSEEKKEVEKKETQDVKMVEEYNPFTADKLFGVAFLGALGGLLIYYVYHQLSEDTRETIKKAVVTGVKTHLKAFMVDV